MPKCKKCGYNVPDGTNVCPACGCNLAAVKPNKSGGGGTPEKIDKAKPNLMLKYFDYMNDEMLYNFGINARNGIGMEKDADAAFKAFTALASRGYCDGMYKLAEIYEEMNQMDNALLWLKIAASDGHVPSRIKLQNLADDGKIAETVFESDDIENYINAASNDGADVFKNNIGGVLEIYWQDNKAKYSGSGFLITKDGYAITNTHVVTGENGQTCDEVDVNIAGESVSARVIAIGDNKGGLGNGVDLALLKLERVPLKSSPLKFADFNSVCNGESVYVIGNSLGYGTCITSGIVSDRLRKVGSKELLMTDCAVNHGNSGGPILNSKGLVIGAIVSIIESAEGMNFAIPVPQIREFIVRCNCGIKL